MSATTYDVEVDIRGEVCPFTFVKSKLAIEDLESGQVLRIILDYRPALENVPRSFTGEGHDVLSVEGTDGRPQDADGVDEWAITVRKK